MRRLLVLLRTWLANRPLLRRRLTLLVYRIPALDMRLRRLLHMREGRSKSHRIDAAHLSEDARLVMERLRRRASDQ